MKITFSATNVDYFRQEGIPGAATDKIVADTNGQAVLEFTDVPGTYPGVKLYAGNGFGEIELDFPLGPPTGFAAMISGN